MKKKWTAAKMFIMKCFHPALRITKSCCRAVPDGKFEVQNDPCTNIGFSISALSRGDRIWKKGTTKFSARNYCFESFFIEIGPLSDDSQIFFEIEVTRLKAALSMI